MSGREAKEVIQGEKNRRRNQANLNPCCHRTVTKRLPVTDVAHQLVSGFH